jgi:hypothetical protein
MPIEGIFCLGWKSNAFVAALARVSLVVAGHAMCQTTHQFEMKSSNPIGRVFPSSSMVIAMFEHPYTAQAKPYPQGV